MVSGKEKFDELKANQTALRELLPTIGLYTKIFLLKEKAPSTSQRRSLLSRLLTKLRMELEDGTPLLRK